MRDTYQLLPPLADDEYEALKADISERGVQVPIEVDNDTGEVLDGHHRMQACRELGITDYPVVERSGMTEQEKRRHVRMLNVARRHLTREQKRQLIAAALREEPERSNRDHARDIQVDHKTVGKVRDDLEQSGELPHFEKRKDPRTGRLSQPAERPAPKPDKPNPNGALYSSDSPEWYTPSDIIRRVETVLGRIDLDPCSNSHDEPHVPASFHYTEDDDGLSQAWSGRVYMNPPYGRGIGEWVRKLREHHEDGDVPAAVTLVPARTDTKWFRLLRDYRVCFVTGRLRFSDADPAPFPSAAFYLGPNVDRFADEFSQVGDIYQRIS